MANMPDILKRIGDCGGWIPCDFESRTKDGVGETMAPQGHSQEAYEIVWQHSIDALVEPATSLIEAMNGGLEHAALQLEIISKPGTKNFLNWVPGAKKTKLIDRETEGGKIKPGDPKFSKLLEDKLAEFSTGRVESLTAWAESKGLSPTQLETMKNLGEFDVDEDPADGHVRRDRQQLYLILYTQHMVSKKHIVKTCRGRILIELHLTCANSSTPLP